MNSVVLMAGFGLSPVMASEIEKAGGTVADAFAVHRRAVRPERASVLRAGRPSTRARDQPGARGELPAQSARYRPDPAHASRRPGDHGLHRRERLCRNEQLPNRVRRRARPGLRKFLSDLHDHGGGVPYCPDQVQWRPPALSVDCGPALCDGRQRSAVPFLWWKCARVHHGCGPVRHWLRRVLSDPSPPWPRTMPTMLWCRKLCSSSR